MPRIRRTVGPIVSLLLIVAIAAPHGFELTPAFTPDQWHGWASIAWRYWSDCSNPSTGLTFDSCNWHYFTLWGLASNIFGVTAADEIGLSGDFGTRIDKILDFLNSMNLTKNGVPYGLYSSDNGSPATTGPTDSADFGRLLLSLYVLKQHLLQLGDPDSLTRMSRVDAAVSRVKASAFGYASDLYGYYASLGFTLWGIRPANAQSVQSGFQSLIDKGPFTDPSQMYGISGIPANTRIDGEPFIDAILEAGNIPQIEGLPSWNDFTGLGQKVYQAQESRSASTGKPEFWTGGGLDFNAGFDSEWIVWTTGATWVVLDSNNNPFNDARVPVAFSKLIFGYEALYDTAYTTNMLNKYAGSLTTANGFMEGVYANGAFDSNVQVQTNQIILSAARYSGVLQTSTSSLSTVTSTSLTTSTSTSGTPTVSTSTITSVVVYPAVPGFPWESIIAGLILGMLALGVIRRRRRPAR